MELHAIAKAENIRDIARELLARADELDGKMPCECGHLRQNHDPAGWNQGWCNGAQTTRRPFGDVIAADGNCKCEEFKAW
jgi:hypothetical protein